MNNKWLNIIRLLRLFPIGSKVRIKKSGYLGEVIDHLLTIWTDAAIIVNYGNNLTDWFHENEIEMI